AGGVLPAHVAARLGASTVERTMKYIILGGGFGSDAGYWTFENGKLVHHGGWAAERLSDVVRSLNILGQAAQLKTPGLAEAVARGVVDAVDKELSGHLGGQLGGAGGAATARGGVVIVNVRR